MAAISGNKEMVPACIIALCVAATLVVYVFLHSQAPPSSLYIARLQKRQAVYASAVILWPAIVLSVVGPSIWKSPITLTVCWLILLYLSFEISVLSDHKGALSVFENSDAVYERGVQVSTVAFAVGTLLLGQKEPRLTTLVTGPVLLALLFLTAAAVPSAASRRRVDASAQWSALQKVFVSFAAGLLCVSVARCLDDLGDRGRLWLSVEQLDVPLIAQCAKIP